MQKQEPNIFLIGMRGSGKTTVARLLSEKLGRDMVELDLVLVEKTGMTIPDIVEKYGWEYFRTREAEIAHDELQIPNRVVSTGGGIVLRKENVDIMKQHGFVLYLKGSAQTLFDRIGDDPNRPALTKEKTRKDEIATLLKQRSPLYESAADEIIDTDDKTPNAVSDEIIAWIENRL